MLEVEDNVEAALGSLVGPGLPALHTEEGVDQVLFQGKLGQNALSVPGIASLGA